VRHCVPGLTGRHEDQIDLVERYAKEQEMFREVDAADPIFSETSSSISRPSSQAWPGPRRPQDRVTLSNVR